MSEINWDLAPHGAVTLGMLADGALLRWFNKDGQYWGGYDWLTSCYRVKTIATRPKGQQKTVADVYEWSKSSRGVEGWLHDDCDVITIDPQGDFGYADSKTAFNKVVCTRQQFEAYAKEQEAKQEEKWTHTDAFGDQCRILIDEPDAHGKVVIFRQDGWCAPVAASSLKPIKPKMTLKQYDACACMAYHFNITRDEFSEYLSGFDITD